MPAFGPVLPLWVTSLMGGTTCLIVTFAILLRTWGYPSASDFIPLAALTGFLGAGLVVFGVWLRKRNPSF